MHVSSRPVGRLLLTAAQQGCRTRNSSTAPSLAVRGIPLPATSPHGAAPGRAATQSRAQPGCGTRPVILSPVTQSAWAGCAGWQAVTRAQGTGTRRRLQGGTGAVWDIGQQSGRGLPHGDADGCRGHAAGRRRCTAKQRRAKLQDGFPRGATSSRNRTRRWKHPGPPHWGHCDTPVHAEPRTAPPAISAGLQPLSAGTCRPWRRSGRSRRCPQQYPRPEPQTPQPEASGPQSRPGPQASAPRPRAGRLPRGRAGQRAPKPRRGTGRDGSPHGASRRGPTAQRRERRAGHLPFARRGSRRRPARLDAAEEGLVRAGCAGGPRAGGAPGS